MSKQMPLEDFRAVRFVLEPDDSAYSSGIPEPPPPDRIQEGVWRHLTILPDEAAVRTSNRHEMLIACQFVFSSPLEHLGLFKTNYAERVFLPAVRDKRCPSSRAQKSYRKERTMNTEPVLSALVAKVTKILKQVVNQVAAEARATHPL